MDKKPKLAFVSDPHLHAHKSLSTTVDGENSRLKAMLATLEMALKEAAEAGCQGLVVAGDMFHVRGTLRPSVLNEAANWLLRAVFHYGLNVLVLAGNHDMEQFAGGATGVDILAMIGDGHGKGVQVVNTPQALVFCGHRLLAIPYVHGAAMFRDVLARAVTEAEGGIDALVLHQGIDDFCTSPDMPKEGLTVADLSMAGTQVFTGHYHSPKEVPGAVCIGAPYHTTFGDSGLRGMWTWDGGKPEFIPLDGPCFTTVDASFTAWDGMEAYPGPVYVRVKATGLKEAKALIKKAEKAGAVSVVVQLEREFKPAHERVIRLSTPEAMVAEYLDIHETLKPHKEAVLDLFHRVCLVESAT